MVTPKKGLQKTDDPGAIARPSFIEDSTRGTDDISVDDLKLPRLCIAQGLSPQMIPGDPARIDGLKLFDFFNDLTGEVYRRFEEEDGSDPKPLRFVVGRRQVKFIEFDPDDRKVPIDLDVPRNDPRTRWTKDENGKGIPPRAIKFVEFICLLLHEGDREPEPIVISIQETNKYNKTAHTRLSGFIKLKRPPAPIYAGVYSATPGSATNDEGTFGIFIMNQCGFVETEELYAKSKEFSKSVEGKTIDINREGDISFNPEDYEGDDPSGM